MKIVTTGPENRDFIALVRHLDADLAVRDGEEHAFYARYNKTNGIEQVVMAYTGNKPLACGAIKAYAPGIAEIKRMYTAPESRGKGIASLVLRELERRAAALSYTKCILETGKKQPEAIRLYEKNGYRIIPNYGPYKGVENSLCFEKLLKP
ncbi:GNAT family N-acetyltransferase [Sinomicrobium kalidii]|uniref:GNAT family N-acetyltransferase n=1 Tax=Sinomicrobium kalidii TaxID=2900738 RepID=UPI001E583412|nr:GNAT family N-acetyltransferase [Sinomicrobium kalidii]UGU17344.1 GNAT family N-acetyltransferase [Sinomicrobium kalidii]